MNKIYVTSDLHLGHDRDFVVAERGFETIESHDRTIVDSWNTVVDKSDEVYLLGDVMLGDIDNGLSLLESLNGKIHIIRGNHDTDEIRNKENYLKLFRTKKDGSAGEGAYLNAHVFRNGKVNLFSEVVPCFYCKKDVEDIYDRCFSHLTNKKDKEIFVPYLIS